MPLLEKLRGINSEDIVQNDFDRMLDGIIALRQENELEPKKGFWSKIPKTGSFWKPFGFLGITFLHCIGAVFQLWDFTWLLYWKNQKSQLVHFGQVQ